MISILGGFIEDKASNLSAEIDLQGFLELAFVIATHDSLAISIPVLNLWSKILKSEILVQNKSVQSFTGRLLDLVSARLIRVFINYLLEVISCLIYPASTSLLTKIPTTRALRS